MQCAVGTRIKNPLKLATITALISVSFLSQTGHHTGFIIRSRHKAGQADLAALTPALSDHGRFKIG